MNNTSKNTFSELKFLNIPAPFFLICAVFLWAAVLLGKLPNMNLSLLALLLSIALPLQYVGKKTPILGKYFGFSALLPIFGSSLLVTAGFIQPELQENIKLFTNNSLVPINIGLLLCGSLLGKLDTAVLKKSVLRYIPVIIIGQAAAVATAFFVGPLLGYSIFDSVATVAFPCFSGGSGAPMLNIPLILTEAGFDGNSFIGLMMAALTLSNVEALILCAVLDTIGKLKPAWTGNGNLLIKSSAISADEKREKFDGSMETLREGILLASIVFTISYVLSSLMKSIINLNYVVWIVIVCIILKLSGILPKQMENAVSWASDFVVGLILPAVMVGLGIGSIDLVSTAKSLSPAFFILVTAVVLAFVIASMLAGRLVGFFPVESGISVGCCSCNIGGTGDIICCEIANRLDLYPFASISTRIGGAVALLALGLVLPYIS